MNIFKLFGSIFVDNDEANKSISKTDKKAQGLGKTMVKGAATVAKFGAAIGGMAIAGGVAIGALAKNMGDAADELLDLSSQTGMSTDSLQKWRQVATVAGVDTNAMADVSKKLTKQMDILSTGTGKAAEAADTLGLSYEALEGMTADERLDAVTEALGNVEDTTERAKLGTDLLGGSWDKLAPVLDVGADKLKDIKDNANVISEDDLNKANEFRIKIDQMKERATLFGQQLIVKIIPTLNKLFDWIADNMPAIEEFFEKAFNKAGEVATVAIQIFNDHLLPILVHIFDWVQVNMPAIKKFFMDTFEGIKVVVNVAIEIFNKYLVPALQTFWSIVQQSLPIIKVIFEEVFNIIKMLVLAAWEIFEKFFLPVLQKVFKWIEEHMPEIEATFKFVFELIKGYIQFVIDVWIVFFEIIGKVYNFVKDVFINIGDLIMQSFNGVTNFIDGIVDKFNKVKDAITGAISKVKEFVGIESESGSTSSSAEASVSDIRGLARGGTTLTSGLIKVGETGPEILNVPKGATVAPLSKGMGGMGKIEININANNLVGQNAGEELGEILIEVLEEKGVFV